MDHWCWDVIRSRTTSGRVSKPGWVKVSAISKALRRCSHLSTDFKILKELDVIADATEDVLPADTRFLSRRIGLSLAAGLAGILVAGTAYFGYYENAVPQVADFDTTVGELKSVTLSDGSTVQLNTNSRVEVRFSSAERRVHLTRGEAYFSVAHNPRRPFSVYAANGIVTAVGTAFTVRLREQDAVEVTVEKGRVALSTLSEAGPAISRKPSLPVPKY